MTRRLLARFPAPPLVQLSLSSSAIPVPRVSGHLSMKPLVVAFLGIASLAAVGPAAAQSPGAEPVAMLLLGSFLLCAGFFRHHAGPHQ